MNKHNCISRRYINIHDISLGDGVGVEVFWKHLPSDVQSVIEDFVNLKIVELNEQLLFSGELLQACSPLFQASQEELVKSLCVQLGYILMEDEGYLGVVRNGIEHDPLELFQASRNNSLRSRFETLFIEDDDQCTSLRQFFPQYCT